MHFTFWQVWAIIVLVAFVISMAITIVILKRSLQKENEIQEKKFQREQEWHDQEADNWRSLDPAKEHRIRELESVCKDNQRTIALLRIELSQKDDFLSRWKLKDMYDQGIWPSVNKDK